MMKFRLHKNKDYLTINLQTLELEGRGFLPLIYDEPEVLKQQCISARTLSDQHEEVSLSSVPTKFC